MSFEKEGYLSEDFFQYKNIVKKEYKEILKLAREANRLAFEMMYKLKPKNDNPRSVVLVVLFIKITQSFQASVILYEYGFKSDAKSISRILLEGTMKLVAIYNNEEYANSYLRKDAKDLIDMLKHIENPNSKKGKYYKNIFSDDDIKKLKDMEKQSKELCEEYTEFKSWEIAEIADMVEFYRLTFKAFNSEVHSDVSSAKKFIDVKKKEFINEPNSDDINIVLGTNIGVLLKGIESMNDTFNLNYKKIIDDIIEKVERLMETNKSKE